MGFAWYHLQTDNVSQKIGCGWTSWMRMDKPPTCTDKLNRTVPSELLWRCSVSRRWYLLSPCPGYQSHRAIWSRLGSLTRLGESSTSFTSRKRLPLSMLKSRLKSTWTSRFPLRGFLFSPRNRTVKGPSMPSGLLAVFSSPACSSLPVSILTQFCLHNFGS
jgi:hypothetical protein